MNINAQNLRSLRYIGGLIFGTGSKSRLNPNGKEHVVKLGNMPLLEDISDGALFQQFPGTLVIDAGDVPKLKGIGTPTVVVPITTTYLPTDASSIAFGAMPAIEQIGQNAFNSFPGTCRCGIVLGNVCLPVSVSVSVLCCARAVLYLCMRCVAPVLCCAVLCCAPSVRPSVRCFLSFVWVLNLQNPDVMGRT